MKKSLLLITVVFCQFFYLQAQEEKKEEPRGKVTGEFFGDYYYKASGDTGALLKGPGQYQQTEKEMHGFEIRRFNLGYDYIFNDKFSARLLLEGNDGFLIPSKDTRGVYVKYAFLQWKNIFNGSNLIVGAQSTPTFSTLSEKAWGYRSVEKNILDYRKHASSNDVGLALAGRLNQAVSYYLMVGNGKSTSVENNKYKRLYATVYGTLLDKKLLFQVYGDYERQNDMKYNYIMKGFLGYQHEKFVAGAEPYNMVAATDTSDSRQSVFGLTLFARGTIIKEKLNGFYRIDFYDDDLNTDAGYTETFMVFGIDYTPIKNINIIPNIWINGYSPEGGAVERKGDIVARVTFRYKI
ncbi:MAG: hypothetical protein JXB00_02115 [Bacteroidales bacterium]|nr:hypothetical protein [Bacteroidales bacterium]